MNMQLELITKNSDETFNFAVVFARMLKNPAIILLNGDLGAGKTVFAKGFAKGIGVKTQVTSPTFTILNEYSGYNDVKLYHFDFYRIENEDEIKELGFDKYFDTYNLIGFVLVEWAEKVPQLLSDYHYIIEFEKIDDEKRKITVKEIIL